MIPISRTAGSAEMSQREAVLHALERLRDTPYLQCREQTADRKEHDGLRTMLSSKVGAASPTSE
jgi:hypothetical protein